MLISRNTIDITIIMYLGLNYTRFLFYFLDLMSIFLDSLMLYFLDITNGYYTRIKLFYSAICQNI